jgi:hypothetical protein
LYVSARGLTTSPIPYETSAFQIDFDFVEHVLIIRTSSGAARTLPLQAESVAAFHSRLFHALGDLGLHVAISGRPNEVSNPIPFAEDHVHEAYDPEYVRRFHRVLHAADRALKEFRRVSRSSPCNRQ